MQFRVEVGLLILSLAFILSLFGSVGVDEDWRLVLILETNPHRYLDYLQHTFLYLILPPAVGVVFSIIGYMRERKSPTGVLKWWPLLLAFGVFFFFWGTLGLRWWYISYYSAIRMTTADISSLILAVYATASVASIFWLAAGVLFMLSPAFKKMIRNDMECM